MTNPYQFQIDQLHARIEENQALLADPELGSLAQEEVARLTQEKAVLEKAAQDFDNAQNADAGPAVGEAPINCIIEIRQGAGGDEAKIWGNDLLRMYLRFIEVQGLKVEVLDEMVIKVRGKVSLVEGSEPLTAYEVFKYESGVHRVQRVPETESQGRIHTSTASVAVLPEVNARAVEVRDEDLEWQFMRAGGAGGQNVNKVNSAVRLTHVPSGIVVTARSERTQGRNRDIAMDLLRSQLWELEEEKRLAQIGDARSVIGRAQRAEKIRTYNYPQNRVTDHRINESWHNLESILQGNLTDVITTVREKLSAEVEPDAEVISAEVSE
ncbi:MAG TPA: PCRF domain-containing protein [Patescibacteria group bacterium]